MSQVDEVKELLLEQKKDSEDFKKRLNEMEAKSISGEEYESHKTAVEQMQKKFDEYGENIDKLTKAIEVEKLKTKAANEYDKDEQKRKEFAEFIKNCRSLAEKNIDAFDTNEFKSVKELYERKDYNSLDASLGGVAVLPEIDSMIDKLIREYSDIRSISSVSTISTDKWEQIKMNQGNGATWEKNMSDYTSQTKNNTFNKLSITIEDLYSIVVIHKNLVSDNAFNLVFHLLDNASEDFAIAEGTSYWSGNGLGELKGILNTDDAADSFEKIERIETATANEITVEDMYDLIGALKLPYQRNAQIKAHRNAITVLRKLRSDSGAGSGTGNFLWQPSLIVGQPQTFNGLPLTQAPELSSTPLVNNTEAIVAGDFRKGMRIIDRMGTEVLRDSLTDYPNIAFKLHKRVGGGPEKGEALKILKTKSS